MQFVHLSYCAIEKRKGRAASPAKRGRNKGESEEERGLYARVWKRREDRVACTQEREWKGEDQSYADTKKQQIRTVRADQSKIQGVEGMLKRISVEAGGEKNPTKPN